MDYCPFQEESKILIRLTVQKPEISAGSMGNMARKGFSFFIIPNLMIGKNYVMPIG